MNIVRLSWRSHRNFTLAGRLSTIALTAFAGLALTQIACAQEPAAALPVPETHITAPDGYTIHQTVDLGGRMANTSGSNAMYNTMVNIQSGPRVLGQSLEMHALPGHKSAFADTISAFGSGFGGDPYNFARLNASKGKVYDFTGIFRRDRQYFDYDLLGNPNIPGGQSIPVGPSNAPTGSFAWPQVEQSPVLFNTVRRMTDVNLTVHPLARFTYRAGYSQNVFEGPSLSPGASSNFFAESIGAYDQLLEEYQRNSTDTFTAAIDWKPQPKTQITFEEQIMHYKGDTFFTLAPGDFTVQEADGTRVSIGNWDSLSPYGIGACNTASMGSGYTSSSNYTILSSPQTAGGLPIINAACAAATSYLRSEPTRFYYPTEILRFQSSAVPHVAMNGNVRYTDANMHLPNYYENFQGLDGAVRSITFNGAANAKREVLAADYGVIWQASSKFSLAEQIDFSSEHQPGTSNISQGATLVTPTTAGNETINYSGPLSAGKNTTVEGSPNGTSLPDYFGQSFINNNLTGTWDATTRASFSITYRYRLHTIAQGIPHSDPLAVGATANGTVTIHEQGAVFSTALRPGPNWQINGSIEALYADNAFTAVSPRQTRHYRVITKYRPRPWATISAAYNDMERHNNTNNNQDAVAAGDMPYEGPLNHVDHSRVASLTTVVAPNEHYGFDFTYAYTDVYAATNICYDNGATATLPGTASTNASGAPNVCAGVYARGSTTQLADWYARDYMDAPTQYGAVSLNFSPIDKFHSSIGYRVSAVNGSQFFNDARSVNGSLNSTYQSPYLNVAYTIHTGLIWKAEYNFYGYGEGGPSGPEYCSTSTSTTSTVVPCNSLPYPTGLTESPSGLTAPRNFHANNITLGIHYEF